MSPESHLAAVNDQFWHGQTVAGESYQKVLGRLHDVLGPKSYLEIGVSTGATLALSHCATIGVDPAFMIDTPVLGRKPFCGLYQMTSDAFFAAHNPSLIFGGPVELAFLDGLHFFEFLLRDFINTERHAHHNSIICLHDCIPADSHVGRRDDDDRSLAPQSLHEGWWAGDVWKVTAFLMKYRPELQLHAFDAEPTGLIAVTGLDPASTLLADRYFDILAEYRDLTLADVGDAYMAQLPINSTSTTASLSSLGRMFWL